MTDIKEELKRLILSQRPQISEHLSDADKGYSYVEIQKKGEQIEIPIVGSIATHTSTSF